MITHDCLNVIIKNFALILIALLHLAKYISKKIFLLLPTQPEIVLIEIFFKN